VKRVNQAPERIPTLDAGGGRDSTRVGLVADSPWRSKLKASARPLVVVVPRVLVEDPLEMAPDDTGGELSSRSDAVDEPWHENAACVGPTRPEPGSREPG
jgi:hypothetical protein